MEKFREDLYEINFPVVLLADVPLEDVLLKPGICRLRLLQWCFSKLDNTIKDKLTVLDDELQSALLKVALELGICTEKEEDVRVFLGNGNIKKQTAFWNMIFHDVRAMSPSLYLGSAEFDFKPSNIKINLIPVEIQMKLATSVSSNGLAHSQISSFENKVLPTSKPGTSVDKTNPNSSTELPDKVSSAQEACKTFSSVFNEELKPHFPTPPEIGEPQVEDVFSQISKSIDLVTKSHEAFQAVNREMELISLNSTFKKVKSSVAKDQELSNKLVECKQRTEDLLNTLKIAKP